ncbi:hypothetical protein KC727_02420 [Candidatus Kaiserbacteria bacterium]|nr:hypothetical protein [Candidatus Kaiserbacteria bacterium]
MFRAIGAILVIWYLSGLFAASFAALDSAVTTTLHTFEAALERSQTILR